MAVVGWIAATALAIALSAILILAVHYLTEINVLVLIVDPAAEVGLAPYVGVFTYIGVLTLWSGVTVSLLTAWFIRSAHRLSAERSMLATYGLLLAWLAVDDLFLVHEEIGLALAEWLGRPEDRSLLEAPVFAVYGAMMLTWLLVHREAIRRSSSILLLLGIAALGVSLTVDIGEFIIPDLASATPWMNTTLSVAEELAKLGGIILLTGYAMVTSLGLVNHHMEAAERVGSTLGNIQVEKGGARAAR